MGMCRLLVAELTFEVPIGGGIVIQGGCGAGKSSVLRVLAGLWHASGGTVTRPPMCSRKLGHRNCSFFVPQSPYTTEGTLREQVLYPQSVYLQSDAVKDNRIREVLDSVGLTYLLERWGLDTQSPWSSH